MDTTTAPWTPLTSLSPTITIKKSPWGAIVVNAEAMTDIGDGWYEYVFSGYTASQDYTYACNPNHSRCYIESGVTDNLAQLISEVRGWGGGSINIQGIQTTIRNTWERVIEEVKKQHDETRGVIESANNDTKSHIDIANWELSSKIESIEIPEMKFEEKEAKKLSKIVTKLDETVKGYIDERKKEKEELGAITQELVKLEMEDQKEAIIEKKRLEEEKKKEEEEQKKEDARLAELLNKEFDKLDEEDKKEKKKELEKELEEAKQEVQEIEQELKTL